MMLKSTYTADVVIDGKIAGMAIVRIWFWQSAMIAYDNMLKWAKDRNEDATIAGMRRL